MLAEACARHGALLAVNDRADIALAAGADVLHLGQDDLPVPMGARVVGDEVVDRALGAQRAQRPRRRPTSRASTTSAPAPAGRPRPSRAAPRRAWTWCAPRRPAQPRGRGSRSAGSTSDRLDEVLAAGADRIVVVRAITEADDPQAAAQRLKARLVAAG